MSDDPKCVAGCVPFYGGEKRHHKDCPYYPESLTKLNADRIEELEAKLARYDDLVADKIDLRSENAALKAKLAKAVGASYQLGMEAALKVIASIGYGKNEDVDYGHEEAFRAVEAHLADWEATTLAEIKGAKQ